MSAATEQNNGDVAVEKVAAAADVVDAAAPVKEDLKSAKPAVEEKSAATVKAADNGREYSSTSPHYNLNSDDADSNLSPATAKGTKRPADAKTADSKKAKKEKAEAADGDSDEEEVLEEVTEECSDVESDEYDIPYDEEDIECEDDEDDNDDGSGSDDQA